MATERQIRSNRLNALKSTGPKSEEGKLTVRTNAQKHGVFSSDAVIVQGEGREDREEYQRLLSDLIEDLQPEGRLEHLLVEKVATNYWRLRRLIRHETGQVWRQFDEFLTEAMTKYQPVPVKSEDRRASFSSRFRHPPMEYVAYGDEVTENDIDGQKRAIEDLSFQTLEANDTVHRFIWHEKLNGRGELPHDWKDRAIRYIDDLSPQMQGKLLRQVVDRAEQVLAEMEEAHKWGKKFEVVSRILSLPGERDLEKIGKYEANLERSIFRNLAELRELQKR